MPLRVAIQMDPVESINPAVDTTYLLALEAQKRGGEIWTYTPRELSLADGEVIAHARQVTFYTGKKNHFKRGKKARLNLKTMDVVLMRQDPPFNMEYVSATYLLETLHPRPLVVNHPASVRDFPEKLMPMLFPEFAPPTLVSADFEEIRAFRKKHRDIVIKPLYGYGGHSIFRFAPGDSNFNAFLETVLAHEKEPWVIQPFLRNVTTSDRRVVLFDGEIAGVVRRVPAKGEIRVGLSAGGSNVRSSLNKQQKKICETIGPFLKKHGLLFASIDIIGDYLMEINVTSPGSLAFINKIYGVRLEAEFWDAVERYL